MFSPRRISLLRKQKQCHLVMRPFQNKKGSSNCKAISGKNLIKQFCRNSAHEKNHSLLLAVQWQREKTLLFDLFGTKLFSLSPRATNQIRNTCSSVSFLNSAGSGHKCQAISSSCYDDMLFFPLKTPSHSYCKGKKPHPLSISLPHISVVIFHPCKLCFN